MDKKGDKRRYKKMKNPGDVIHMRMSQQPNVEYSLQVRTCIPLKGVEQKFFPTVFIH